MTPAQTIATAILAELRNQFDSDENKGTIGWIDSDNGTADVGLDGRFDLDKAGQALIDRGRVPGTWRCFHCDALFTSEGGAREHFGPHEGRTPACQIKAAEGGLVRALRQAEEEAERATWALHDESADGLKAWRAAQARNAQAVASAEEVGYQRGMADMRQELETLRRALAWHGDPVRMATTREEWQRDVDEAMRWVKDNPEDGRPSFSSFNSGVDPTRAPMAALRALRDGQEQADMEGERVKVSRQAVDEVVTWAALVLGGAA